MRLPGFRPGKAPKSLIKSRFQSEIRSEVIEALIPQAFRKRVEQEDLKVVGTPDITDLHFEPGEPIRFKAEFEIAPDDRTGDVSGTDRCNTPSLPSPTKKLTSGCESMRETKAEYVNVDPRADREWRFHVLAHLKSLGGLDEPVDQDNLQIEVGGEDTLPAFTENLLGAQPDETKEFDITYPEDYGSEKLAGKTVHFQIDARR